MQAMVWIEPDNMSVYATCGGASPVCGGVLPGVVGVDSVCIRGSICKGGLG